MPKEYTVLTIGDKMAAVSLEASPNPQDLLLFVDYLPVERSGILSGPGKYTFTTPRIAAGGALFEDVQEGIRYSVLANGLTEACDHFFSRYNAVYKIKGLG